VRDWTPEGKDNGELRDLALLFTKLGFVAFGGPAAHIAMMRNEVVERRRWMGEQEFLDLMGATNLIPGPNSTELAIHIGRVRAGWRGLMVAGTCFIVPAMFIVLAFAWAYARSPFYERFHRGFADRPLKDLPVLTKQMVMEHFDELVTDPTVRLADVEAHLATLSGGDELLGGRYRVASTLGTTGRRGLFLWDQGEWAAVLASYNRSFDWAGVGAGLTHRTRMAVVSSTTPSRTI
jgi:hypothetical protein